MCWFCLLVRGRHGARVTVMEVSRNTPKGVLRKNCIKVQGFLKPLDRATSLEIRGHSGSLVALTEASR